MYFIYLDMISQWDYEQNIVGMYLTPRPVWHFFRSYIIFQILVLS